MIESQKYEPGESSWHHVAITLAVGDNKHGAFSTLPPTRAMTRTISRWNFGSASPLNHLVLNFPHRMRKGKKNAQRNLRWKSQKERGPMRPTAGPQERWTVRDLVWSQQCEKTALAWEAHNSKLIFYIRRLIIGAVAPPLPLPLFRNLWPFPALWPELPGNSGKERKPRLKPVLRMWAMRSPLCYVHGTLKTHHVWVNKTSLSMCLCVCVCHALCETEAMPPLSVKCRVSVLEQQDGRATCQPELGLCGATVFAD